MKINADPIWLSDLSKSALNGISLNNKRISEGSDKILVNPAYEQTSDDELTSSVDEILSTVHLTEYLREIEDSNRSKFGPRSIAKPWNERRESLFSYFDHKDYDPGEFDVTPGRLRPTSLETAANSLIKSTNSGLPYYTNKGSVLNEAVENAKAISGVYPCVLFTRTQAERKTRDVWGYPIGDMLHEMQIFQPWLEFEKSLEWRSALLGPDEVDKAMTRLLFSKSDSMTVESVDFSAYDTTVRPEYAYYAFSHIAKQFQKEYHDDIYRVFRRFVTIPIYTPEGEVVGPHGVPSGSGFTNTIDSLVQFAGSGTEYRCQIQGDDGVYLVPEGERDMLLDRFKSLGFNVNKEKSVSFNGNEAIYLQRYYHPDYRNISGDGLGGVYSLQRALARIKYLETWTNFEKLGISGEDFFALRTITILENCKHHPGFKEFVKTVKDHDRTGLNYSRSGLIAYSNAQRSKAKAGVFNDTILQGINSFETVKLLNNL